MFPSPFTPAYALGVSNLLQSPLSLLLTYLLQKFLLHFLQKCLRILLRSQQLLLRSYCLLMHCLLTRYCTCSLLLLFKYTTTIICFQKARYLVPPLLLPAPTTTLITTI